MRQFAEDSRQALSKLLDCTRRESGQTVIPPRFAVQGCFQGTPGVLHRPLQRRRQTWIVLLSTAQQEIEDRIQRFDAAGHEHIIDQSFEE